MHGLITLIRHWDLSTFYLMAELWGNMILTVLAWGFVNESIKVGDAKRFYPLLAVGADSAGIFSGQFAKLFYIEDAKSWLPYGHTGWEQTLISTLLAIVVIGVLVTALYYYVSRIFQITPHHQPKQTPMTQKDKIGFFQSIKLVAKSKYLLCLTTIVVSYYLCFNLFDVIWTAELKRNFLDTHQLNAYMNHLTSMTGLMAALIALFISGNIIRKFGWTFTALITPIVLLVTAIGFFSTLLLEKNQPQQPYL